MRVGYELGIRVCTQELLKVLRTEAFDVNEYEDGVELLESLIGAALMFGDDDLEEDLDDEDFDDEEDLVDLLDEDIFIIMVDDDDDDELTFDGELN